MAFRDLVRLYQAQAEEAGKGQQAYLTGMMAGLSGTPTSSTDPRALFAHGVSDMGRKMFGMFTPEEEFSKTIESMPDNLSYLKQLQFQKDARVSAGLPPDLKLREDIAQEKRAMAGEERAIAGEERAIAGEKRAIAGEARAQLKASQTADQRFEKMKAEGRKRKHSQIVKDRKSVV